VDHPIDTAAARSPNRRRKIFATVLANRILCREHFRLDVVVPAFAATDPGHFVQLHCRDELHDVDSEPLEWRPGQRLLVHDADLLSQQTMLARPFSLAGRVDTADGVCLSVIHRVVGTGTAWLAKLSPGDAVSVLGPLGNPFLLPEPGQTALLVGGGVGIPPMLYLAERLRGRAAIAFCGATTRDLLPLHITGELAVDGKEIDRSVEPAFCIAEFAGCGIPSVITTDDGSFGMAGYVTQALERYLDQRAAEADFRPTIYTCGPELMMRRVADIAVERNIPCQVAVERAMACGMGTCQSCVIKVRAGDAWRYRLSCTDGPVFIASELLW
jgi:dihydroorotate dehydrogenase electron transfer subunit